MLPGTSETEDGTGLIAIGKRFRSERKNRTNSFPESTLIIQTDRSNRASLFAYLLILALFYLSGAAALVYEISWSRQIGLLFGHTVDAAAVVLAGFFAGMAIGYLLGGRLSSRVHPLTGYALAECAAAIWAITIPFLLDWSGTGIVAPLLSHNVHAIQLFTRTIFCFLLLLPATICLGITLPMMVAWMSGFGNREVGNGEGQPANATFAFTRISIAYAFNTFGALTGVLTATFFLLIRVGVVNSSFAAAGISLFCGLAAIGIRVAGLRDSKPADEPFVDKPPIIVDEQDDSSRLTCLLAIVSGAGTLALQVLYTRMFSLVFHNSTYTFGLVVAVFLGSLAIGSLLAALVHRLLDSRIICGIALIGGAITTLISVVVFVQLTGLEYFSAGDSFTSYISAASWLVCKTIMPPVILLGMILPTVWKLAGDSRSTADVVGRLTALNTIAATAGSLIAGFVLLRLAGLWGSFLVTGVLFFVTGLCAFRAKSRLLVLLGGGLVVAVLAVTVVRVPAEAEKNAARSDEQIIRRFNSSYGWIDVLRVEGSEAYKIRQNLHYRFGRTGNTAREFRQAHIPLLIHSDPNDVLFLGLGTGMTAGGAIPHPEVESLVAVELIPEVIPAVRMLKEHNHNLVDHQKTEIRVDDGRHFLLANERKFDVIVSDLFVPWESESGYLYTVEHYQTAKKRLNDGGIFCQWLAVYQLGSDELESIANSFASVFPNTSIWWGQISRNRAIVALVGSENRIEIDSENLRNRIRRLEQDNNAAGLENVRGFRDLYIGQWRPTEVPLNTDEFPRVEFLTPVTNRDRELLIGNPFQEYYDMRLTNLADTVRFTAIDDLDFSSRKSRHRQRLRLAGN